MTTHRRMQTRWTIVGLVSLVLLAAAPVSAEDVRPAIEAANRKWEAGLSRGDAAGVAALYTADGEMLPAHSDIVRGPRAIAEYVQVVLNAGIRGATLTTLEVDNCGNTAHEVGSYEFKGADGTLMDHGQYVVIWKKEGGAWKLHRDIWTTSVMPAKQ